jgi:hypothetical protein
MLHWDRTRRFESHALQDEKRRGIKNHITSLTKEPILISKAGMNLLSFCFREHEAQGKGAFNFRGHMIDMPLVKQAQNILDMKKRME